MLLFTFYLHDPKLSAPVFEIEPFETLHEAQAHARRLLSERRHYEAVEISLEDKTLMRLERVG